MAMKPQMRAAITAGVIVTVGAIALALRTLTAFGVFSDMTPSFNGTCAPVAGIIGPEDLQIDARDRLVFVSATNRRVFPEHPDRQDGLYTMSLDHPEAGLTKLAGTPRDFHPHGISLYRGGDGKLTLMAVNHEASGEQAVEIFDVTVTGGAAKLVSTGHIEGGLLISPNDLVAVSPTQFYVTNDHGSTSDFGKMLETWLLLPRANVLYFDGNYFQQVAKDLIFANGIAIGRDGSHIYVSEMMGRTLFSYKRNPFSGTLTEDGSLALGTAPDNIDVADDGALWVAGHPKLLSLNMYSRDPAKPSPSEIFRVTLAGGVPQAANTVYANDGSGIGAATVGAVSGKRLFIGSVFDRKLLACTMQ